MGETLVCGALWMGEVRLVDAQRMPVCVKRTDALPEGEGSVTMCRHYTWVCALTAMPSSLALCRCGQSVCLAPCRPGFKSRWGDYALPSLQYGQWVHNVGIKMIKNSKINVGIVILYFVFFIWWQLIWVQLFSSIILSRYISNTVEKYYYTFKWHF